MSWVFITSSWWARLAGESSTAVWFVFGAFIVLVLPVAIYTLLALRDRRRARLDQPRARVHRIGPRPRARLRPR